jgi:hypothetical protein
MLKLRNLLFVVVLFSLQAKAALEVTQTSLDRKSCIIYDEAAMHATPEIDFLTQECPGLGGYQVMISGADARYPLSLVYNGKQIQLTRIQSFHDVVSNKVDWLFARTKDGEVIYKALIHQMLLNTDDHKMIQARIVTKLDKEKTCSVGLVKQAKGMKIAELNALARKMAEEVDSLKCMDLAHVNY